MPHSSCHFLLSSSFRRSSYFNVFDSQRVALVNAYHPSATFSFSANTTIPARARVAGFHSSRAMPNQRKLDWKVWVDSGSRNLNRIGSDPQKLLTNLHIGGEAIVKVLSNLPQTTHDIAGPPEKFSLDSFPVPHGQGMGLLLMIHGQFTESESVACISDGGFYLTWFFSMCQVLRVG